MKPQDLLTHSANEVLIRATTLSPGAISAGKNLLLILGSMLADANGIAAIVLRSLGRNIDSMRQVALERATSIEAAQCQQFDRDIFLRRAQSESRYLGDCIIGVEHLLLALCREQALELVQLFNDFGVSSSQIRYTVYLKLGRIDLVPQNELMTCDIILSEREFRENN